MEVEDPTQHSPLYVDIQSNYRVVFKDMKYLPVLKHWEICVKLEDKKEEQTLGETKITWPHTDPPHTIIYDSERNLLHWENSESLGYLPLNIPQHPVYDLSSRNTARANSKLLIRCSFNGESGDKFSAKIRSETPWKKMLLNGTFVKKSKQDFEEIKPNLNPLFEDRLEPDQQQTVLSTIAKNYEQEGMRELMERLLQMRFFDLGSLNSFIAEKYSAQNFSKESAIKSPVEMSELSVNGLQTTDDHGFLRDLVSNKQFLLFDNAFVALLRCCSRPKEQELRKLLITKNMPLDNSLRRRIIKELENDVIISLLELYSLEFVTRVGISSDVLGKVFDLLLFITNGFNDKVVWDDAIALHERIGPVLGVMTFNGKFAMRLTQVASTNKMSTLIGKMPPPDTDFRRHRVTLAKYVV